MTKSPLKLVPPAIVKRTVTAPGRKPNAVYRTREHLTGAEVDRLIDAAKRNRWGHRDSTMILVAFRHGLRSSELVDLRWDQIDFTHAVGTYAGPRRARLPPIPYVGDEMRALRKLQREQDPSRPSCSPASAARRSRRQALRAWWSALVSRLSLAFRLILTCCATPAASPWPTRATIRGRCRPISATPTSSTRCDINPLQQMPGLNS